MQRCLHGFNLSLNTKSLSATRAALARAHALRGAQNYNLSERRTKLKFLVCNLVS